MELRLWQAIQAGKIDAVKDLLKSRRDLDVNWRNDAEKDQTVFQLAASLGSDQVVKLLLSHPEISVNQRSRVGETAIWLACVKGATTIVPMLLRDSRVDVNQNSNSGMTPLAEAAAGGFLAIVKWFIASGREFALTDNNDNMMESPSYLTTDVLGAARMNRRTDVVTLLERFYKDPNQTRIELRIELGITGTYVVSCNGRIPPHHGFTSAREGTLPTSS